VAWPPAVKYIQKCVDKKELWARPWVNQHFNRGTTVSSFVESSNSAYMKWMLETLGDLVQTLEWTLRHEEDQCKEEQRKINQEFIGLKDKDRK